MVSSNFLCAKVPAHLACMVIALITLKTWVLSVACIFGYPCNVTGVGSYTANAMSMKGRL